MRNPVLTAAPTLLGVLLLADVASAQWGAPPGGGGGLGSGALGGGRSAPLHVPPPPPRGTPVIPPLVDHPAWAGQPAVREEGQDEEAAPRTRAAMVAAERLRMATEAEQRAAGFRDVRVEGRQLVDAVERVLEEMEWYESLEDACAAGAARGKPVLWLHSLGDLDGFA